jgi:hypothetical protein
VIQQKFPLGPVHGLDERRGGQLRASSGQHGTTWRTLIGGRLPIGKRSCGDRRRPATAGDAHGSRPADGGVRGVACDVAARLGTADFGAQDRFISRFDVVIRGRSGTRSPGRARLRFKPCMSTVSENRA